MRYKAGFLNAPAKAESVVDDHMLAKDPAPVIGETVQKLAKPADEDSAIPPPPQEPGPEECCMSGCAVCVRDLWAEALAQWKEKYGHLDTAPKNVPRDVSGDAFAALEAQLAAKHAAT
jgi:hypothetical protein